MARLDVQTDFRRAVLDPLIAVGRALKRQVVVQGLCRCAAVLAVAAIVQFALDALLVLGTGPRVALGIVVLGIAGYEFWKCVLRPAAIRVEPGDVAALVERRNPALQDRLASAVAFATAADVRPERDSPAMIHAVMDESRAAVAGLRLADLFRPDRHRRYLMMGLAAVGVPALLAMFFPDMVATFLARNVALREVPWPSRVTLVLEGFTGDRLRWPIGDDLMLVATALNEVPPGVRAVFESASGESVVREMARRGENQFVLDYGPLQNSMRVRFSIWRLGVDEKTQWYTIDAVERPSVREVAIRVTPPEYTGLEAFTLATGQTSADILRGARVHIRAELSKPVVKAALRTSDQVISDAAMESDTVVSAEFSPVLSGAYYFDLLDADGLTDTRPVTYGLRLAADPPPKVRFSLPGAGEMLVPTAILPLNVECEDNLGLKRVELVHGVVPGEATTSQPAPETEELPNLEARQQRYTVRLPWPLLPLTLKPGDQLTLQVRAEDYQPPAVAPTPDREGVPTRTAAANLGESGLYTYRIVTPEELAAELSRRESEWRREFEQIIKAQEQLNLRVTELFASSDVETASTTTAARLGQESRSQRQQAGRMRTVSRQFEQILAEMEVNQLANAGVRRRLDAGVIAPMRRLVSEDVPAVAELLEQLRAQFDRPRAEQVIEAQTQLTRSMYAILANMLKWEGYDEAVSLLRDIIRLQGDLNQDTQRRLQKEIEKLLEDGAASQPENNP
ncbi:MAG: hypothetical protein DCC65_03900 [Planctomycetota bacterium]|nr:MAG: hypothetical protein DCC65_03900 [Planctomycetota bacterium]